MNQYKDISIKNILIIAVFEFALVTIGISLFYSDPKPFIVGIVFGFLISLLNFRLLYLTLAKAIKMPPGRAQNYTASRYTLRYMIVGVVIVLSIKAPYINLLGTIIGLLLLKSAIFLCTILSSTEVLQKAFIRRK